MIDRLPYDHDDPAKHRREFDNVMGVRDWSVPGTTRRVPRRDVPANAPAWWSGDEDASQSFLRSMGVLS
jgi:hypothetical protein